MTEKYPFRVCKLEVNDHDDVVQCDLCDTWNHIRNLKTYFIQQTLSNNRFKSVRNQIQKLKI